MRLMLRRSVLLPQPDGPMRAVMRMRPEGDRDVTDRAEAAVVEAHVLEADDRLGGRVRAVPRPLAGCQ